MRTITISCPSCRTEFKSVTLDQAERVLFHGCEACRERRREPQGFRGGRARLVPDVPADLDEAAPSN